MSIICLMVRENHKMVREMSGKSQGILWGLMAGHPDLVNSHLSAIHKADTLPVLMHVFVSVSKKFDLLRKTWAAHDVIWITMGISLLPEGVCPYGEQLTKNSQVVPVMSVVDCWQDQCEFGPYGPSFTSSLRCWQQSVKSLCVSCIEDFR